ncbi:MAG: hypothetical protein DPW14_09730 [Planctomycetes bacterium]|nr:hypothetical protein [Planctomycetota bacterium]
MPTRAEATDVVNAILDGTDAVMLSGETATGDYPVECVNTMRRLALVAEQMVRENPLGRVLPAQASAPAHAVAQAVVEIARKVKARAVLCATTSGRTAQLIASLRPSVPVLGATHELGTYRRLTLSWGVLPALVETAETTDEMVARAVEAAQRLGVARRGDLDFAPVGIALLVQRDMDAVDTVEEAFETLHLVLGVFLDGIRDLRVLGNDGQFHWQPPIIGPSRAGQRCNCQFP